MKVTYGEYYSTTNGKVVTMRLEPETDYEHAFTIYAAGAEKTTKALGMDQSLLVEFIGD